MKSGPKPTPLEAAVLILREAGRVTIDIAEVDAQLIAQAFKIVRVVRGIGEAFGWRERAQDMELREHVLILLLEGADIGNASSPVLILREAERLTIDIAEIDAQLIVQALKLGATVRGAFDLFGQRVRTPSADARELALIRLLEPKAAP